MFLFYDTFLIQTDGGQWKDVLLILLGILLSLSLILHVPLIIQYIEYRNHLKTCLPPVETESQTHSSPSTNDGYVNVDLHDEEDGDHGAAAALLGISNENYVAPSKSIDK